MLKQKTELRRRSPALQQQYERARLLGEAGPFLIRARHRVMKAGRRSGPPRRRPDAALIRRSLAGDQQAARDLHGVYAPIATRYLRKLGIHRDDIDDARQEVFLQFFRYLAGFRAEAELATWLFRLCLTEARRMRRLRKSGAALGTRLRNLPASGVVPPASRSEETIQALVRRAFDRMRPEQRQAFILFELDGLTGKEVAKIGGRSLPATVRRRYEAQRLLQEMLGIEKSRPPE
jgi:RNA polymerase sigma-70 factor (ECF subfamily)